LELPGLIEDYRQGLLALIVPLTLLKHHLNRRPVPDWVSVPHGAQSSRLGQPCLTPANACPDPEIEAPVNVWRRLAICTHLCYKDDAVR